MNNSALIAENDYLEEIRKGRQTLEWVADKLLSLSMSFDATGNEIMGNTLSKLCEATNEANERINDAVNAKIHKDYHESQLGLGKLIVAAMGVPSVLEEEEIGK